MATNRQEERHESRLRVTRRTAVAGLWTLLTALAVTVDAQIDPVLLLDSDRAGDFPAQTILFEIEPGALETHAARVSYPPGFALLGFRDLGPRGTRVGAFLFEPRVPEAPQLEIPVLSLGDDEAYADVISDGTFSRDLEPNVRLESSGELTVRLPFGGDADPDTLFAPFSGTVTLTLARGPVRNPEASGSYTVEATITSVDPDTDGPDDGVDPPPQRVRFEATVEIQPSLIVDHARLAVRNRSIAGFRLFGRTAAGALGDLSRLDGTEVAVAFGSFAETLDGDDFRAVGAGWIYLPPNQPPANGEPPGVHRVFLRGDGQIQLEARGLELPPSIGRDRDVIVVPLSLRVRERGVATVLAFDSRGGLLP